MRNAFADEITKLADADPRVVLLSGDIGNRLFNTFKEHHPDRFLNCGVAEANMIGVGAGMGLSGLRPVTYTITTFVTSRCYEQIKLDVCYHKAPVIITGVGAGLSYASLGPTHHSFEDIASLRALPGLTILCPADPWEVRAALRAALKLNGPVYLRLGKKGEPPLHADVPEFEIGRALVMREGTDVALLSTGNILPNVLAAAELLQAAGISAGVLNFHTVKPLDQERLQQVFGGTKLVATIEEHSLIGGFGSAVAEWAADQGPFPARLVRFGIPDRFIHEAGNQKYARKKAGLSAEAIAERIKEQFHK
ncbi:MAG TPA: transketolase [Verrucomicrobia bacterium]|nr:MAG: transketolase [Lentisphaerae bacterium GWF2_57_35]HBA84531.1 transketolase [Verrucomicrobiota bacterium]